MLKKKLSIFLSIVTFCFIAGFVPVLAQAARGTCTNKDVSCGADEKLYTTDDGKLEKLYCGEWCQVSKCKFCVKASEEDNIAEQGCSHLLGDKAGEDSQAYQNCVNCIKNSGGGLQALDNCANQYKSMTEDQIQQIEGGMSISGGGLSNLTTEQLNNFNPLRDSTNPELKGGQATAGGIVSAALKVIYPLVGVLLFALLIWGGIEVLMAGTTANSSRAEQGKKRIIAAIIGAVIVLASLIILKVIEALLGIDLGI